MAKGFLNNIYIEDFAFDDAKTTGKVNFKGETKWRPIRVGSLYSSLEKAKKYINKVAQ